MELQTGTVSGSCHGHEVCRSSPVAVEVGSILGPTMAGFNARTFTESRDKEIALVMLQAYYDWAIDERCAAYPGRSSGVGDC